MDETTGAMPETSDGGEDLRALLAEANARADAAEGRARELASRSVVDRAARGLGIVDEEAAWLLMDRSLLVLDDAGMPMNADAVLRDLSAARPWLLPRQDPAPVSVANPPRAPRALSREDVRRMSPEQILANWEQVEEALRR